MFVLSVVVVYLLFISVRPDDLPCTQQSSCVCTYPNGSSIDLSPIDTKGSN